MLTSFARNVAQLKKYNEFVEKNNIKLHSFTPNWFPNDLTLNKNTYCAKFHDKINDMFRLLCPIRLRQVIPCKEGVYTKIQQWQGK